MQAHIPQIVNALERIGDTSVIASPRLVTLNNRAAELGIGERTGYRTLVSSGRAWLRWISWKPAHGCGFIR